MNKHKDFTMGHNRAYSTVVPKTKEEAHDSHGEEIINLELGNGGMSDSSSEIGHAEPIDYDEIINGSKTASNFHKSRHTRNDRKHHTLLDEDIKRNSIGRKHSPHYPKIYAGGKPRMKHLYG